MSSQELRHSILTPTSDYKSTESTCFPVWGDVCASRHCPRLVWRHSNLIEREREKRERKKKKPVFSLDVFSSRRSNAISLWSKYPHRLPLSPVKMTFREKSFRPRYAAAPPPPPHPFPFAREAKFSLFKESSQQCGHASPMLSGKRSLERLYKCVVLSAPPHLFPISSPPTGCEPMGMWRDITVPVWLDIRVRKKGICCTATCEMKGFIPSPRLVWSHC